MTKHLDHPKELGAINFRVGNQEYGLRHGTVQEIVITPRIIRVPKAPSNIKGIVELHGKVVPIVDIVRQLGTHGTEVTPCCRIVVVEHAETSGFPWGDGRQGRPEGHRDLNGCKGTGRDVITTSFYVSKGLVRVGRAPAILRAVVGPGSVVCVCGNAESSMRALKGHGIPIAWQHTGGRTARKMSVRFEDFGVSIRLVETVAGW